MPKKYLIAGVGNTLRSDDGIGIKALEYLKTILDKNNFDFYQFSTMSIDIVHYIKEYSATFIIDALDYGARPGSIRAFALGDINLNLEGKTGTSSHGFSLKDLLKLYKTLDIKNSVYIIGIQPKDLSYKEGLSKEVSESLSCIHAEINQLLNENVLLHTCQSSRD